MQPLILALLGGVCIGLAAVLLMAAQGQIMGVSGILGRLLPPVASDWLWRVVFVAGVFSVPFLYPIVTNTALSMTITDNVPLLLIAGFIVGLGVTIGNGCTSGHGVCGLSRLSARSIIAVGVFMLLAVATVFVTNHMFGG